MSEPTHGRSLSKRILLVIAGLLAFTLIFVIACRIAVMQIFTGIAQSKSTGLSAVAWDVGSMWSTGGSYDRAEPMLQKGIAGRPWVSRNADLRMRTDSFEHAAKSLNQVASSHQGFLESLVTESHSGRGRALSAVVSVPSTEFYPALSDLKRLGRTEAISEAGEDSAVKLENATRNLTAAQSTLNRLQNLQRDRKGQLHEALEVEKEIAQADSSVRDALRQREALLSTVAQAHIHVTLLEDFRAPFEAHFAEASLQLRNSFIEGLGGIFQSVAMVVGVVFEYGLPLIFWGAILLWPARTLWRRFRAKPPAAAAAGAEP
jgi:hypothetical protein